MAPSERAFTDGEEEVALREDFVDAVVFNVTACLAIACNAAPSQSVTSTRPRWRGASSRS